MSAWITKLYLTWRLANAHHLGLALRDRQLLIFFRGVRCNRPQYQLTAPNRCLLIAILFSFQLPVFGDR